MLSADEANAVASKLVQSSAPERVKLSILTRYMRGQQPEPWLPDGIDDEYREIARASASNWLQLVVRAVGQGLIADGFGSLGASSRVWAECWQANGMDARQHALNEAALVHGHAYLIVTPSVLGPSMVSMRPESAERMALEYGAPDDEWPTYAVRVVSQDRTEVYDADARYTLVGKLGSSAMSVDRHSFGVTPVAKVQADLSLLGSPQGEIAQVIPIQNRIVDATFNLQMVAKYGAFPQRWISGMVTDAGNAPVRAYVDSILTADDPDTKFGQFAPADLRQFVDALETHVRHLAAITQTPPHYLLGSMVNLSADALAAAESGLQRKIRSRREMLSEGYESALRLAAVVIGDDATVGDPAAQLHWQDVESRSLAQTSDALLKLSQLGVPVEMLFRMIPGWTQTDAEEATQMAQSGGGLDALVRKLIDNTAAPSPVA